MLTTTRARRPTSSRSAVGSRPSARRSAANRPNATAAPKAPNPSATSDWPSGPEAKRGRAEEPADAEHREEAEDDGQDRGVGAATHAEEPHARVRKAEWQM